MKHILVWITIVSALLLLVPAAAFDREVASLTPGPSHQTHATSTEALAGITLDEDVSDLRRLLGAPEMVLGSMHGSYLVYKSRRWSSWLALLINADHVESIIIIPQKDQIPSFRDPFGLTFGDDISSLEQIRPNPVPEPPDMLTYNIGNSRQFVYGIRGDRIYAIELTSGATNIPPVLVDFEYNGATPIQAITLNVSESGMVVAQRLYAAHLPCGNSYWRWISNTQMTLSQVTYSRALLECQVLRAKKAVYFRTQ